MTDEAEQSSPAELSSEVAGLPALIVDPDRVEHTVKLLLMGHRDFDVLATVQELWPDQEIGSLVAAAMSDLVQSANAPSDMIRGWAIEAARAVYRKAIADSEWRDALAAIKMIVDLTERS